MKRAELISPHPRAECLARLKKNVGSAWAISSQTAVKGSVGERRVAMTMRISYGNSFQTVLRGRLSDENGATRISCRFGMYWFVIAFLIVSIGAIAGTVLFDLADPVAALIDGRLMSAHWEDAGLSALMLGFLVGLIMFGRYLARNERGELLDFLRRIVDAKDVAITID